MNLNKLTGPDNEEISSLTLKLFNEQSKNNRNDFWHYTSIEGLLSIFSNYINKVGFDESEFVSECTMLASNIRFLNDSKEFDDGVKIYESKKGKSTFNDDVFLISFCGEGDLLSQWKWYGKESGISICFSPENILYKKYSYVDKNGKEKIDKDGKTVEFFDCCLSPLKVHYNLEDKEKYLQHLEQDSRIKNSLSDDVLKSMFIPLCKDVGFAEEKESRLIFFKYEVPTNGEYNGVFDIKYKKSYDGNVKPALSVKMKFTDDRNNFNATKLQGNIISKIIVGPGVNQENIFNSLIHIFDRNNFRYHSQFEDSKTYDAISFDDFNKKDKYIDGELHKVKYSEKVHIAYKCKNNIIIMKSSIPFRG